MNAMPQRTEVLHGGRAKVAAAGGSRPPLTSRWPQRPSAHIVSETIPVFFIACNSDGFWIARDAAGQTGGIFLTKRSALRFAKRLSGPFGGATVFLPDRIELDIKDQGDRIAAFVANIKRRLVGTFRKGVRKLLASQQILLATISQARSDERRNRAAIERDLFQGRARYSTKNDDDLPVIR